MSDDQKDSTEKRYTDEQPKTPTGTPTTKINLNPSITTVRNWARQNSKSYEGVADKELQAKEGAKSISVPRNPPILFPTDLWPQTNMILLEAQKKFPLQIQTLELCKYVVAEMTPVFVEAVKAGKMKASAVQGCGGGMEDLLNLLLTLNDDDLQSSDGLSSQALRLGDEVRKSDEWLKLAKAIAELQVTSTAADPVRTEAKQQQVSLVQNIDGSAQNVKRDPGGKEVRRNYRDEVRQWMERMHLANNAEAAKRLGVSTSTLKSIMSNKGKVRYGKGTLDRVLAEISKSHR